MGIKVVKEYEIDDICRTCQKPVNPFEWKYYTWLDHPLTIVIGIECFYVGFMFSLGRIFQ